MVKKSGLQCKIQLYSRYNIYVNCQNHRLALCSLHFIKKAEFAGLLLDYDALFLEIQKYEKYCTFLLDVVYFLKAFNKYGVKTN